MSAYGKPNAINHLNLSINGSYKPSPNGRLIIGFPTFTFLPRIIFFGLKIKIEKKSCKNITQTPFELAGPQLDVSFGPAMLKLNWAPNFLHLQSVVFNKWASKISDSTWFNWFNGNTVMIQDLCWQGQPQWTPVKQFHILLRGWVRAQVVLVPCEYQV